MKNFLKIFIFLEIILLAYIFNTSIYNIYEKNNIATEKLEGYVLEETSPEILDKFYTIFTEKYFIILVICSFKICIVEKPMLFLIPIFFKL